MSSKGGGFNPATPPSPPRLSLAEMQEMILFFKKVFEESSLSWWIIAAGVGAIFELLHVVWLALRYLFRF